MDITIEYEPRAVFMPYHMRDNRWSCIVAHRRCGKTYGVIYDMVTRAIYTKKKDPIYAYIAPFYSQAKLIAWNYLKQATEGITEKILESELSVKLVTGATIRLFGADNPDALRGIYLDGVVLDEYADMAPSLWTAVIRPLLSDRKGWATFIGTPKGHNSFYEIRQRALYSDDWFYMELRASETGLLDQEELDDARKQMDENLYMQEFECSFSAAIIGAYYGDQIAEMEDNGQLGVYPWDPDHQVETWWDLGIGDSTAIWFVQQILDKFRVVDYYEAAGEGLAHYAKELDRRPYVYSNHIGPHDLTVRELGTGETRKAKARELGINFQISPKLKVEDGIQAVRSILPRCYFHRESTLHGLEALRQYRTDYNEKTRTFRSKPLHDWTSHAADAFRIGAQVRNRRSQRRWDQPLNYDQLDRAVI